MYNIVYPLKFGSNDKLITSDNKFVLNKSRINTVLDHMPVTRPMRPTYGSLLGNIEQQSVDSPNIIEYIIQFKSVLDTFASRYIRVFNVTLIAKSKDRSVTVEVDYDNL